jgi:hypothetical protein
MRRSVSTAWVLVLSLQAFPALAQFEGRLEYRMTRASAGKDAPAGAGTAVVWLAPSGARMEMSVQVGQGAAQPSKFVSLWKRDDPDHVYFLSDARKAYSVMDTSERETRDERPRITRLGASRVAGFSCQRARITTESGSSHEVCVTDELGKLPVNLATDRRGWTVWNELRQAGLDGVPVSWKSADEADAGFTMTLTSARKQSVPGNLLEVPAGYARTGLGGAMASPEQAGKMDEAMAKLKERMKGMDPEQRKRVEKMMEQMGTGAK